MKTKYLTGSNRVQTPWGPADTQKTYAEGITQYSTPSHGGFNLSRARLLQMPPSLLAQHKRQAYAGFGWFEEDCEWCLVVLSFRDVFKDEELAAQAESTLRHWYPEAWEQYYSRTLEPGQSNRRDEDTFYAANKDNWLTIAAWGDWQTGVPEGYVGVCAVIGGNRKLEKQPSDERYYLVPQAEYDARKIAFVIDTARHQLVDNFTTLPRKQTAVTA